MHVIQNKVVAATMDDQVVPIANCDGCTAAGAGGCAACGGLTPRPTRELQQQQVIGAATSGMPSCSSACASSHISTVAGSSMARQHCFKRSQCSASQARGSSATLVHARSNQLHACHSPNTTMCPAWYTAAAPSRGLGAVPLTAGRRHVKLSRSSTATSDRRFLSAFLQGAQEQHTR